MPDPAAPQALNRYMYTLGNPLKYIDPSGHDPWWLPGNGPGQAGSPARVAEYYYQGGGGGESVVGYIWGEMNRNPHTPAANKIRGYIQRSNHVIKFSSQYTSQEDSNGWIAVSLLLSAFADRVSAYELWRRQVDYDAPWDHKATIDVRFGRYQVVQNYRYFLDVWSNIHYGYVGASIGFESGELLWGAGAAQYMNEMRNNFRNQTYRDEVLSSPLTTALDYPTDQAAIRLGIHLWNTYGSNLTQNQLIQDLENWEGLDREPRP